MTQRSKSAYASLYGSSGSLYPDNTTGLIGEEDVRSEGEDNKDSFFNLIDDAYIGAKGFKNSLNTITNLKAVVTLGISAPFYTAFRDTGNGNVLRVYELVSGTDAESSPDIIRPDDYAGTTNEKVWKLAKNFTYDSLVVTASGTDTYTATPSPAISAYATNQKFYVKFTNANTGAATLNLSSLGAKDIKKGGTDALEAGDIGAGQIVGLMYDGTNLQMLGGAPAALYNDRGNYDASGNAYPSTGGSGGAGAIVKGDFWTISVAGTLPTGISVNPGDQVRALVNSATNTQADWAVQQVATKATAAELTTGTNDTKYATSLALEGSKYLDQDGSKIIATASGTDTYTATISPAITAYASGQTFTIKFTNANTGSSTINLNTLGAKTIKKANGQALIQGDIAASAVVILHYNGTDFIALGGLTEQHEGTGQTTDGTTYVTIASFTALANARFLLDLDLMGTSGSNSAFWKGIHRCERVSGTLSAVGNIVNILTFNTGSDSALQTCVARINISTDTIQLQVRGVAATTIDWKGFIKLKVF